MEFLSCEISISNNLVRLPKHSEKFIVHILDVKTRSIGFFNVVNFGRTSGNTQTEVAENSGRNHLRTNKQDPKSLFGGVAVLLFRGVSGDLKRRGSVSKGTLRSAFSVVLRETISGLLQCNTVRRTRRPVCR